LFTSKRRAALLTNSKGTQSICIRKSPKSIQFNMSQTVTEPYTFPKAMSISIINGDGAASKFRSGGGVA
jgi:hypothetical protein